MFRGMKSVFSMGCISVISAVLLAPAAAQADGLFKNSLSISPGLYAAEGFGSNFYLGIRYNHYFKKWTYFIETSLGFSSMNSQVLEDLANFQVFESNNLLTYEFLFGYDMAPLSNFPFLVAGIAGINQGGQTKFSYVVGLGKQIPLAQFLKVKRWGLRYDIRDQIFKQRITNTADSFTAHNLIVSLGLQYYF